jgi:hypothetical protein
VGSGSAPQNAANATLKVHRFFLKYLDRKITWYQFRCKLFEAKMADQSTEPLGKTDKLANGVAKIKGKLKKGNVLDDPLVDAAKALPRIVR